jgi:hypothetical protein
MMAPLYIVKRFIMTKKDLPVELNRFKSFSDDIPEVPEIKPMFSALGIGGTAF